MMKLPILTTKLWIPELPSEAVLRPHLIHRLGQPKLSLISAPAGFGKSTLATLWVHESRRVSPRRGIVWISLDEGDNDPGLFMGDLVAALRRVIPTISLAIDAAIESPSRPGVEILMTMLLNELAETVDPLLIVLDDYHLAACEEVDQALSLLVEFTPPRIRLLVVTRQDPQIPLSRYRARGQLMELRAEDLRFSEAETTDFLGRTMKLNLTGDEMTVLGLRTEGWIAALQLAAISLRGRGESSAFIKSFTGSHRFVLDYLVEDVLTRIPDDLLDFLLQTSILDRLSASLCEAVTQGPGRVLLDELERTNLFLLPLDDRREWYRYHHLFAEVLHSRLCSERPAEVPILHGLASHWYERAGFADEAILHALKAEDTDRASGLIEQQWRTMDGQHRSAIWLEWAKRLPDAVIRARPVLSMGYGWALLDLGDLEASECHFRDAENPPEAFVVADKAEYRLLSSSIALARAYRALAMGDITSAIAQAQSAKAKTTTSDHRVRMVANSLLGLARYTSGELASAEESIVSGMESARSAGRLSDVLGMTFLLADLRVTLGRLKDAEKAYRESFKLAEGRDKEMVLVIAELHRGRCEVLLERGDREAAREELRISVNRGEESSLTDWNYRIAKTEALVAEAWGDWEGAFEFLDDAERFHVRTPLPDPRPVDAMRARIWIRQGDPAKALEWAQKTGRSTEGELSFLDEFAHATFAMALVAHFRFEKDLAAMESATKLLKRLLGHAEAGGRTGSVIELLTLLALAYDAQGSLPSALAALEQALNRAEPEGYVQVFLKGDLAMGNLLKRLPLKTTTLRKRVFIGKLLAAMPSPTSSPRLPAKPIPLVEPLSEREVEVLRLLQGDLSGPEMARELYISLNTLRTHTKSIFAKLDATTRRAAVRKATELGLLQDS